MRLAIGLMLCLLHLGATAGALAVPSVQLRDFAQASRLLLEGEGALYALSLPERVYAGVTRPDLGDLRVFNGAGAVVPHELTRPPGPPAEDSPEVELPLFPLYDDDRAAEQVKLRVLRKPEQGEILIEREQAPLSHLIGYVLDARQLDGRIDRLRVHWSDPTESGGFLVSVEVQAGDDLDSWRTLEPDAVLADLTHSGHRLKRDKITIPATKAQFYRLEFNRPERAVELVAALARQTASRVPRTPELWRQVAVRHGSPGEYLFDIPASLPVSGLRIALPERNTLTSAVVYSRKDSREQWRGRAQAQLYRLSHGDAELINPDLDLAGVTDPHWRLVVDQAAGGIGSGLPDIHIGWIPHRLVFVARGDGPFTLAWGSARAGPLHLGGTGLGRNLEGAGVSVLTAILEDEQLSPGGAAALAPQVDWRQWMLWGVLVVGALALVVMAVRLFRQMGS